MKAIYNKPLTEIVMLNVQDVLVKEEAHWSNDNYKAESNTSFFDDESNKGGNNSFFDD